MNRDIRYAQDLAFMKRQIDKNVWYIKSSFGSDTYVIIGSEKAVVIDTGENRRDLRKYVENITDLPLVVCNTHGHFDHTGANGQFKDCPIYMSQFACNNCKTPHNYLNPEDFDLDYTPLPIKEGDCIDLGDRKLEVYEIPCHSPGSLAFLGRKSRMIFTGDEIETGQVLAYGNNRAMCSVQRYRDNMLKLKSLYDGFDYVCPAHNGAPVYKEIVEDYLAASEKILSEEEGKKEVGGPTWLSLQDPRTPEDKAKILSDPQYRRMEYKGASLVYSIRYILYSEENPL